MHLNLKKKRNFKFSSYKIYNLSGIEKLYKSLSIEQNLSLGFPKIIIIIPEIKKKVIPTFNLKNYEIIIIKFVESSIFFILQNFKYK